MPDYNPNEYPERWLLGACSSGDPLRWAVVAVAKKVERLRAELAVAERSMPKVAAREPSPDSQARIEAWYARMDEGG